MLPKRKQIQQMRCCPRCSLRLLRTDDELKENFEDEAGQIIKDEVEQDLHAHHRAVGPSTGSLLELDVRRRGACRQQQALHLPGIG